MKVLVFFVFIALSFLCHAKIPEETISNFKILFDRKNRTDFVPKYRSAQTPFRKFKGKLPSREGLDILRVSGSGQPSEMEIKFIKDLIDPDLKIVFVDLRKEKHAYLNGEPILWMGVSEEKMMSLLAKPEKLTIFDRAGTEHKVKPITENTEKEITQKYGIGYVRFPTKHAEAPPPPKLSMNL